MQSVGRWLLGPAVAALLLGVAAAPRAFAQEDATATAVPDAAPAAGYPAGVHAGACAAFDPVPRDPLKPLAVPTGDPAGAKEAAPVARSRSTVPASLEEFLAADHAIVVRGPGAEPDAPPATTVACGEIGGVRRGNGALVIGLREANESFFVGLAVLAPSRNDPAATVVEVYLFEWTTA